MSNFIFIPFEFFIAWNQYILLDFNIFANYYLIITIIFLHTNYITYYGFVCSQHMTKHFAYYYQFFIIVDLSLHLKASVKWKSMFIKKIYMHLLISKLHILKNLNFSFYIRINLVINVIQSLLLQKRVQTAFNRK